MTTAAYDGGQALDRRFGRKRMALGVIAIGIVESSAILAGLLEFHLG